MSSTTTHDMLCPNNPAWDPITECWARGFSIGEAHDRTGISIEKLMHEYKSRDKACEQYFEAAESKLEDQCYEDATIEAAELVGPNAHEYDSLVDSISERLFIERSASFLG